METADILVYEGKKLTRVYEYAKSTYEQKIHGRARESGREVFQSGGFTRGTEEWWSAIRNGAVPTLRRSGVISKVFFTSPNYSAKFQIGKGKDKFVWFRLGEPDSLYQAGKFILMEYVTVVVPSAPSLDGIPHPAALGIAQYLGVWIES